MATNSLFIFIIQDKNIFISIIQDTNCWVRILDDWEKRDNGVMCAEEKIKCGFKLLFSNRDRGSNADTLDFNFKSSWTLV